MSLRILSLFMFPVLNLLHVLAAQDCPEYALSPFTWH